MKHRLKHFAALTFSTLVMAIGVYFFKFSNNFTFGGITGLAVLIAKAGIMSAGDFTFVTNMLLLILGFIILGTKFAAKTAYCSILLSVTLSALERLYPDDTAADRSAYVGALLCHCSSCIRLRYPVQYRRLQRRNRYHCHDFKKILQL